MGLFQLVCFGVGAIVGTGIFVGLSDSVAEAGPAVVVSFILAAITCVFTAFAFAELGGAIPVSGSSYSFAYAGLGERTAFLVGWCLLLEYGVSVSAVAVGWSQYVNELLDSVLGIQLPHALSAGPGDGGAVNLPAVIVIALACVLLVRGVRESARATAAMAVLKPGRPGRLLRHRLLRLQGRQPQPVLPGGPRRHRRRHHGRLLLVHRLRRDHHGR